MSNVILLVEGDGADRILTLRALQKSNIVNEVVLANDGGEALDYLFATGQYAGQVTALPEVVLLDLNLPEVDGFEVLRQIRADRRTQNLAVIILTSSVEDEDRFKSFSLGGNSYIRKPIGVGQLADAVRKLGLQWVLLKKTADSKDRYTVDGGPPHRVR